MQLYDAIVLGVGGVGSAGLWQLALRGLRVLGIDQFTPPHNRGSSHGHSRIIRQAYFEHPGYVPLLKRSYALWDQLASITNQTLLAPTGLVLVGPPEGTVLSGVRRSAIEHGLPIEELTAQQVNARWPVLHVPQQLAAVYEALGGALYVERCVQACVDAAARQGAECWWNTPATAWHADSHGVVVQTPRGPVAAKRLVITAGPWAARVLHELGLPVRLRRASLFWFAADNRHDPGRMPGFLFQLPDGVFYGFPALDHRGVKVSDHAGGTWLNTPEEIDRNIDPTEEAALRKFLSTCLPGVSSQRTDHAACYYTMTPDEHFIIDQHPRYSNVAFAAGLSGHGFKFAPVLGEILADLAISGETTLPAGFLGLSRARFPDLVQNQPD